LVAGVQAVLVQVWDVNQQMPEQQAAGQPDSEHGRGLLLVDAFSARWGAYQSAGSGKVVWAIVKPDGELPEERGAR
jgi:hypothetical protein